MSEQLYIAKNGQWQLTKHDYVKKGIPQGIISPDGEFHAMKPHEEHISKMLQLAGHKPEIEVDEHGYHNLKTKNEEEYSKKWGPSVDKALKAGYVQVGMGGEQNFCAHHSVADNPHHPAMRTLRQHIKEHWNEGNFSEAQIQRSDEDAKKHGLSYIIVDDLDHKKFMKRGVIAPRKAWEK